MLSTRWWKLRVVRLSAMISTNSTFNDGEAKVDSWKGSTRRSGSRHRGVITLFKERQTMIINDHVQEYPSHRCQFIFVSFVCLTCFILLNYIIFLFNSVKHITDITVCFLLEVCSSNRKQIGKMITQIVVNYK